MHAGCPILTQSGWDQANPKTKRKHAVHCTLLNVPSFPDSPNEPTGILALEADPHLFHPDQLPARLQALEDLDRLDQPDVRLRALKIRLESANDALYSAARAEIATAREPKLLRRWLTDPAFRNRPQTQPRALGFDHRDEIVTGVLQLREPDAPRLHSPEMVPYQPTAVRHILDLITIGELSDEDILIDLGSGLGHVPLLVTILTGIRTLGIELEPTYVATAQTAAQSLRLDRVRFLAHDARTADLSCGTIFYLFTPFTGSMLTDMLSALSRESEKRPIRICSLGPCTQALEQQSWLKAAATPNPEQITRFDSR